MIVISDLRTFNIKNRAVIIMVWYAYIISQLNYSPTSLYRTLIHIFIFYGLYIFV